MASSSGSVRQVGPSVRALPSSSMRLSSPFACAFASERRTCSSLESSLEHRVNKNLVWAIRWSILQTSSCLTPLRPPSRVLLWTALACAELARHPIPPPGKNGEVEARASPPDPSFEMWGGTRRENRFCRDLSSLVDLRQVRQTDGHAWKDG